MKTKHITLILGFAIAGVKGFEARRSLERDGLNPEHQLDLLKLDWGQPGFCTEWDRDYDPTTHRCGKRGRLIHRHFAK